MLSPQEVRSHSNRRCDRAHSGGATDRGATDRGATALTLEVRPCSHWRCAHVAHVLSERVGCYQLGDISATSEAESASKKHSLKEDPVPHQRSTRWHPPHRYLELDPDSTSRGATAQPAEVLPGPRWRCGSAVEVITISQYHQNSSSFGL